MRRASFALVLLALVGCSDKPSSSSSPEAAASAAPKEPTLEVVPAVMPTPKTDTLPLPAMSAAELPAAPATSAKPAADPAKAAAEPTGAKKDEPAAARRNTTSPGPMAPRVPRGAATE